MNIHYFPIIIGFLFFSCNESKQGILPEIPVDTNQNASLPLSEITEELVAIELELTDESFINTDYIVRIIVSEDEVIVAELNKILVFSKDGKFIRSIGSRGQGPGEYNYIQNLAIDKKSQCLFIINSAPGKIICYDLNGKYLKESHKPIQSAGLTALIDINYIKDELLLVVEQENGDFTKGLNLHSAVYQLNDNLQVIDSTTIRNIYLENLNLLTSLYMNRDFMLHGGTSDYLYYGDFYTTQDNSEQRALCDTLYRFEDNHLVPDLKLKFKNNGMDGSGNKLIYLFNIYRSSRYIFSCYKNNQNKNIYYFCYDTKTGKGYNMQDGYMDDINQIEERISIRPFNFDTEMFYYLHTHQHPDDLEEPNPTLYIGKLKK
ncbi:hypothetical protein FACS1894182_06850 [Bacteroidia bacterium]|nr:hypothetical protein FACS1894182_06850 [Bacteroidia bacterium]